MSGKFSMNIDAFLFFDHIAKLYDDIFIKKFNYALGFLSSVFNAKHLDD